MTRTEDTLRHHLEAFGAQDLEEILADYNDRSIIITDQGVYQGLDEIRQLYQQQFQEFGQEGVVLEIDDQGVDGEGAYLRWHGHTPEATYEACTDTFVIRDGVIESQSVTGVIKPP